VTAPRRLDTSTQREELLFALQFLRQWGRESGPAPLAALQQHLAPALQLPLAPVLSALRFAGLCTLHTSPPAAETSTEGNLAALEWTSSPAHGRLATALQHLSSYDLGADRSGSVDLLFQQSSSTRPLLTERTLVATGPTSRLWRAVHPRLGQALAIKQLWPATDAAARARFVQAQRPTRGWTTRRSCRCTTWSTPRTSWRWCGRSAPGET